MSFGTAATGDAAPDQCLRDRDTGRVSREMSASPKTGFSWSDVHRLICKNDDKKTYWIRKPTFPVQNRTTRYRIYSLRNIPVPCEYFHINDKGYRCA